MDTEQLRNLGCEKRPGKEMKKQLKMQEETQENITSPKKVKGFSKKGRNTFVKYHR